MRVLIAGNWAANKGDRAVLTFILSQLTSQNDIDKIYVSTTEPQLLQRTMSFCEKVRYISFGCDVFSGTVTPIGKILRKFRNFLYLKLGFQVMIHRTLQNRRKLSKWMCTRDFYNAVCDSDRLIVTGGHHITSLREFDALHTVTYDMGLLWLANKPYILWAQTIGPLEFKKQENKRYMMTVLQDAQRVYVRDPNSLEVLQQLHYKKQNIYQTYDSVYGLYAIYGNQYTAVKNTGIVGISIFYGNYKEDAEVKLYIQKIVSVCNFVLSLGFRMRFFPMETEQRELDIIHAIIQKTQLPDQIDVYDTNVPTQQHVLAVNACDLFIGHKTHSVIIALITNTPVIAFCYHPKTADFMDMYGLGDFAISDEIYRLDWFKKQFEQLAAHSTEISEQMKQYSDKYSAKVVEDFSKIFQTD